jgi:hypothetical protein
MGAATKRCVGLARIILDEPIPEKLQQALHGKRGEAEVKPKRRK